MAEPQAAGDDASSGTARRKATPSKRYVAGSSSPPPCGACKFLRRKCHGECVFAPYFGSDQGSARFAAVHKVFGASNVSKLLSHVPTDRRQEAVVTISYEAQARLADPVYGCVSTVLALQQQVAALQGELAMVQNQLINNRLAFASVLQGTQQQLQPIINVAPMQPTYSNNSSASTTLMNMSCFNPNFDIPMGTVPSSHSFDPLLSQDEEENEQESMIPQAFNPGTILHHE